MMKRVSALVLVAAMGFATAACSSNEKRYAAWGGGGAAVGALAGQAIGHDTGSTLLGAAIGGGAGSLVAHHKNKKANEHKSKECTYRDREGHNYKAPCTQ